jgi:hypothetical protein
MRELKLLDNEDYVELLAEGQYDEVFSHCQGFIKDKVESYLRNFPYYYQFRKDYLHEVYIHILTKSLPSPAFLKACQSGNSFKFYLAKSVRNALNTLLNKEKENQRQTLALESLHQQQDREEKKQPEPSCLSDKSQQSQADSQDIIQQLTKQLEGFLNDFKITFPKIAFKLILLLKLQARAAIYPIDLTRCFPQITAFDITKFKEILGEDEVYRCREDLEIFEMIYPFFQTYRQEKGTPSALQRWVNQYVSGDKFSKGILERLEIVDNEQVIKIEDKRMFADFLYVYFKNQPEEKIEEVSNEKTPVWSFSKIPSLNWALALVK